MIRNVLTHIQNVENYGIIAILLFFAAFTGLLIWAFRIKKPQLDAMGRLPLDESEPAAPAPSTLNPASCHHE